MNIGLLGFGVVGRGLYDLTAGRADMQVKKVVCLEDVTLPDAEVTKDFQSVLNDETIDTVVEAMGGIPGKYLVTVKGYEFSTLYYSATPLD